MQGSPTHPHKGAPEVGKGDIPGTEAKIHNE